MPISIEEFDSYGRDMSLGLLYLPNGKSTKVDLQKVWSHIEPSLVFNLVVGIVIIGSSVREPDYTEIKKIRRKYFLFGPKIEVTKRLKIEVSDVDIVIITKDDNRNCGSRIVGTWGKMGDDYCGTFNYKITNGVHIIWRSLEQIKRSNLSPFDESIVNSGVAICGQNTGISSKRNASWGYNNESWSCRII